MAVGEGGYFSLKLKKGRRKNMMVVRVGGN